MAGKYNVISAIIDTCASLHYTIELYFIHSQPLVGLVKTPCEDVVVEQRQVVWGNVEISVGQGDESRAVDDRLVLLVGSAEDGSSWLLGVTSVVSSDGQWGIGDVELVDESDESGFGRVDQSTDRSVVAVVVRNSLSRHIPSEFNSSSGLGEGCSVVGDGGVVTILQEVRVVGDGQPREDWPFDPWVLVGTGDNVSREQRPSHGLGDTGLKVDWHGVSTGELSECHLLSSLGRDRLGEEGGSVSSIEVGEESIDTRFSPSGESLTEVDKVSDSVKVVGIGTLLGWGVTAVGDDVGEEGSMADFLVGHELDQRDVVGVQSSLFKLFSAESRDTVVEQVELDPLLVQSEEE